MAISWPKQRRLIGKKHARIDGPDKATGLAKYSFDINRPGMLHARILRCPHAHAKLVSLDTTAAEQMPGVKAVHVIATDGRELRYAGDEVVALAADTEEHAADALRAIKVKYEVLPFFVKEEDALKERNKGTLGGNSNVQPGGQGASANFDTDGYKGSDVTVEGTYGVPVICHQCLESHGLVAEWDKEDKDRLTVWASTQAVFGTANALAGSFRVPAAKVKCITQYMGGGFGSKFGPDIQGIAAAALARKAGAPVKLMLDREEEVTVGGNRPSAYGTIKIGGTKEGKITAFEVDCYGSPGVGGGATVNLNLLPYVYVIPNFKRKHSVVRLNAGSARAMRAPGHPQNCFLTESAVDDFAAKIGIDPLKVRLMNLPPNDEDAVKNAPMSFGALRHTMYATEIQMAAQAMGWEKKWHPPGQARERGPVKSGVGMALHTWGGAAGKPNDITVTINSDGSVLVQSATQDLGTAERTVLPIVVAEVLGLDVKDVTVRIGESTTGRSSGSGGSTTCPGTSPPTLKAALVARDDLFMKIAPRLKVKAEDLTIDPNTPGKIVDKTNQKSWTWKEACARLGTDNAKGQGQWAANPQNDELVKEGLSNVGVGGVQMAEVKVDTETGVVRCTKVVAVQDCGMIINKLGCESQVAGGVIMAVNYALFEERIMDRLTGRQVNPNMEFYKLGGIEDMPEVVVLMHDMPERGVIGIGEPPTISGCAAIGNAVHNAIGVRVPYAPFTPERVLAALAKKGGKS
jgi:xanthine dehydrogenase YagR molybdenum-binding subunit